MNKILKKIQGEESQTVIAEQIKALSELIMEQDGEIQMMNE